MRKIIEYCLVSADGIVLDDPFPFHEHVDDAYLRDRLGTFTACDATLWGRTAYERFASRWAGNPTASPYAARLSALPKLVFSSKLEAASWGPASIVRGEPGAAVREIKKEQGGDLLLLGHGLLGETLFEEGLIDVLEFTIFPVFVGHGRPLLRQGQATTLKLVATRSYSMVVKLTYEPQY